MGEFVRDRLPDPVNYFESEGLPLHGKGKWRTAACQFHGGSDSMRINTESGSWVCMACGMKGGDVLAYAMERHAVGFVEAARSLGAYVGGGKVHRGVMNPTTLSARDAMQVAAFELLVLVVVIADVRAGLIPSERDWARFLLGAGRIEALAMEFAP